MLKRMKSLSLLIGVFVFMHQNSYARETYTTIGKRTCQTWNEDLEKSKNREKMFEWVAFANNKSWLIGFATGVNFLADNDLLNELDAHLITDWTTKYCEENPEKDVMDAVAVLLAKTKKIVDQERSSQRSKKR